MNHLYFSATFGTYLSQKAFALDFCYGFGQELVSTIQEYNGLEIETASLGKTMMQTSSMVTFIFIPATICLYGFIFWRLLKTNKINKLGNSSYFYHWNINNFTPFLLRPVKRCYPVKSEDKWNHHGWTSGFFCHWVCLRNSIFCFVSRISTF